MMVKNIYVADTDRELWDQAAVIASRRRRSLSWVIHEALRRYVHDEAKLLEEQGRATP